MIKTIVSIKIPLLSILPLIIPISMKPPTSTPSPSPSLVTARIIIPVIVIVLPVGIVMVVPVASKAIVVVSGLVLESPKSIGVYVCVRLA